MMLNDIEEMPNKTNWASLVKQLLMPLGFYEVWFAQGVANIEFLLSVFKQRQNGTFMQNWRERLEGSSRANFYNSITQFQLQPYLENINVFKYMQAFSKLRMSSHRLAIESGRWVRPTRIPIDERKCSLCQVLEDEYHFVLECNVYAELRYKYIPKHYWKRPSMYKFVELLNTTNMKILRNLSMYINHAFQCRTEQLYVNRI